MSLSFFFSLPEKNILEFAIPINIQTISFFCSVKNIIYLFEMIRYAFADILESERSYVADLQRIIEIYLYELTRQECPWFVKEKKDLLFSNIEDIFAFHKV
jgi:hypothetical protein